jgi:hypothetical protein
MDIASNYVGGDVVDELENYDKIRTKLAYHNIMDRLCLDSICDGGWCGDVGCWLVFLSSSCHSQYATKKKKRKKKRRRSMKWKNKVEQTAFSLSTTPP